MGVSSADGASSCAAVSSVGASASVSSGSGVAGAWAHLAEDRQRPKKQDSQKIISTFEKIIRSRSHISVTPYERENPFSCSLTKTWAFAPVIGKTQPGTKPPGAAREDRTAESSAGTGAPALSFFPAVRCGRLGLGAEVRQTQGARDYGTSLNLSGKGPAMKGKRGNARRV